jgi:small-conductance mechanosensitive channel
MLGIKSAVIPSTTEEIRDKILSYLSNTEMWVNFFFITLKIVVIIIASRIVIKIIKKSIAHMTAEREMNPLRIDPRRTRTIGKLISNIITHTINFIALLLILDQLGFALMPLLAGAGVVGLAIGFGAQNLVRDIITGFFIIFEDQFAVGDVITTKNITGTVEEIGIRTTVIKSWTGEVHIIPNGGIDQVTNFSVFNSIAVVDVSVAYEADIDTATKVISETAKRLYEENENMVKEPEVLGVQALGNSDVVLRVTVECMPMTHYGAARLLRAEIKKALDAQNIEIPYPKMVTYLRSEKAE